MVALPLARRRRTPDPRIAVGLLLVVASALGTTALVAGLTRTAVVYRADRPLVAGERLTADVLGTATVRLGDEQGLYLSGPLPAGGLVATRTIAAGEMVPRSAVGSPADLATATVVVPLASALPDGVGQGDLVDLWSAPRRDTDRESYGPPVVLVSGATVARAPVRTGLVLSRDATVEVQVPRDRVADVLQAQAGGARVSAVAIGGGR